MGWHAARMFLFVALAFLLRYRGFPKLSQIAAVAGMMPPLVSLTGYVYGVPGFHGAMSLTSTIFGLAFAATPFLLGARTGIMRAISSPWDGGRYGRLQILVAGAALKWPPDDHCVARCCLRQRFNPHRRDTNRARRTRTKIRDALASPSSCSAYLVGMGSDGVCSNTRDLK